MGLSVLSVASPFAPVGPDAVGGAEQVLSAIDEALVEAGHRSLVVACEGSRVFGTLIPTPRFEGPIDERTRLEAHARHREAIARTLAKLDVDLVHLHGFDFHRYLPQGEVPTLITLHRPASWYPSWAFHPERPNTFLVCVSHAQLESAPRSGAVIGAVPNGVRLDRYVPRAQKAGYALALGRICPERGLSALFDVTRQAGVQLLIAGQVAPEHERYFREELAPRLDATHRFLGALGPARKRRLLAAAQCLLVANPAAEAGSHVAMEALACGTPVVAPAGALSEIVEDGKTGFLAGDEVELARAIRRAARLDPAACRAAAESRFDAARMVERYLGLYRYLVTRVTTLKEVCP
jgi:glycosyltransferase involved in cell wall biosynthesis